MGGRRLLHGASLLLNTMSVGRSGHEKVIFGPDTGSKFAALVFFVSAPWLAIVCFIQCAPQYGGIGVAAAGANIGLAVRLLSQRTVISNEGLLIMTPFRVLTVSWNEIEAVGREGHSVVTLRGGRKFVTSLYSYRGVATPWLAHHTRLFRAYALYMPTIKTYFEANKRGDVHTSAHTVQWRALSYRFLVFVCVLSLVVSICGTI